MSNCSGYYDHNQPLSLYISWKRNSHNYRVEVLKLMKTSLNETIEASDKGTIIFTEDETIYIKQNTISSILHKRKKLNSQFERILTMKLHNQRINCSLKCRLNYFSIGLTQLLDWSGRYFYVNKECSMVFQAQIAKWNDNKLISIIHCNGKCNHEMLNKTVGQCRGKERLEMEIKVTALGPGIVDMENKYIT